MPDLLKLPERDLSVRSLFSRLLVAGRKSPEVARVLKALFAGCNHGVPTLHWQPCADSTPINYHSRIFPHCKPQRAQTLFDMSISQTGPVDGHLYIIRNVQYPMVCLTLHDKPKKNTPGKLPFLPLAI